MSTDWISTPLTADVVRGALDLETTPHGVLPHRLPAWARRQVPDEQLAMAESQPSGVRLRFRTAATAFGAGAGAQAMLGIVPFARRG